MGAAQDRGRAGEALAAAYLELVGCRCVARNVRLGGVEVDLVVDDGATRVLVEVRAALARRLRRRGRDASTTRKRERLLRAARALEQQGVRLVRVDVIAIDLQRRRRDAHAPPQRRDGLTGTHGPTSPHRPAASCRA